MSRPEVSTDEFRLYHGTRTGFRGRGGLVVPRARSLAAATTAPTMPGRVSPKDAANYVFLTEHYELAWVYAFHASGRGKPRVLEVHFLGELEDDPESSPGSGIYRVEAAIVQKVHFDPPITEAEAREGWILPANS